MRQASRARPSTSSPARTGRWRGRPASPCRWPRTSSAPAGALTSRCSSGCGSLPRRWAGPARGERGALTRTGGEDRKLRGGPDPQPPPSGAGQSERRYSARSCFSAGVSPIEKRVERLEATVVVDPAPQMCPEPLQRGGPVPAVRGPARLEGVDADLLRGVHCLLYTSDAADERSSVDLG